MTSKILREIARPFRKLSGHKPAGPALRTPTGESAELQGAVKLPHVEYLAPTSTLGELLPASNQAEIRLMTRLIRTHVWAMPEHELMVLGAIVATLKPRKLFEFGTYTGGSTLTIAANAADNFEMTTIDVGPQPKSKVKYVPGSLYQTTRFARHVTQIVGDSLEFDVGDRAGKMDFVFVDANHSYKWAHNDTELALKMIRPGGVILWHDYTWLAQHAECMGVTETVNEFERAHGHCHHIEGTRFAIYLP